MRNIIVRILVSIITIYLSARLLTGVEFDGTLGLFEGAGVLAVLMMLIRPLIMVVVLPLNLLSFGLLGLIINTWMIQIADLFLENLQISDFWTAFGAAVIFWGVDWMLKELFAVLNQSNPAELA